MGEMNTWYDPDMLDFPCSALFRGIDLHTTDRWVGFFATPPDERWFEQVESPPQKTQEQHWQPRIEIPKGGRDL